jgi:hypothetical protein
MRFENWWHRSDSPRRTPIELGAAKKQACVDTFPLTQQFLSTMLGVRRATVNVATGMLKKAGFIRYVRGQITVTDRPGLESASCECYAKVLQAYDYDHADSVFGHATQVAFAAAEKTRLAP